MGADDEKFLRRLRRRDEQAFHEFVGLYQRDVFLLVLRILSNRSDAEDVTQEVFVTVFKKIHQFRGDASLKVWTLTIAANHARSRLRYRKSRRFRAHDAFEEAHTDPRQSAARPSWPSEEVVADELETTARRAFLALDEEQRQILTLRDLNGLRYDEIGQILDLPVGTVRSRLFRARRDWHARIRSTFEDAED